MENTIRGLDFDGEFSPDELGAFAARFQGLTSLVVSTLEAEWAQYMVAGVNPSLVESLMVGNTGGNSDDEDRWVFEIDAAGIAPLTNLRSLRLNGHAIDTDFSTALSKLTKLVDIGLWRYGHPEPDSIRLLLSPLTRPPALER